MLTVKDLKKKLEDCDENSPLQFYFLENYNLHNCQLETIIDADGQTEFTIEKGESNGTM